MRAHRGQRMKCSEIMSRLEVLSPVRFAYDWDNVGLILGREDKDIQRVYIALDATDDVVEEAIALKADMLLTHHPLIFHPVKRITASDFIGRRLLKLAQADMCYYAMHTNFDVLGMADAAADELELKNAQVLSVTYEDEISKEGIGRFGKLSTGMTLAECTEFVKKTFRLSKVAVYGEPESFLETAAVLPGSGESGIKDALEAGVDVLITGDIDHHAGIDALAQGLNIIDAGHYGLEKLFLPYMRDFFARNMAEVTVFTAPDISPFQVV